MRLEQRLPANFNPPLPPMAGSKTVFLRMRGRARAEMGQLKGETQSKSHLLLRRGHSILKVCEVTCESLQQTWSGKNDE
jgi:hypothetical protein